MKAYGSYDQWKEDQSQVNQVLISELEKVIGESAPHLERIVKWGQDSFVDGKTPKMYIHAEPDYVQIGFYSGSKLKDPHKILNGNGKFVRHVKIYKVLDVNKEHLKELIIQVI